MAGTSTRSPTEKPRDGVADLGDRADGLVPEDAPVGHGGDVALQDVQVGPADGGGVDLDHHVRRFLDRASGTSSQALLPGPW